MVGVLMVETGLGGSYLVPSSLKSEPISSL